MYDLFSGVCFINQLCEVFNNIFLIFSSFLLYYTILFLFLQTLLQYILYFFLNIRGMNLRDWCRSLLAIAYDYLGIVKIFEKWLKMVFLARIEGTLQIFLELTLSSTNFFLIEIHLHHIRFEGRFYWFADYLV